MASEAARKWCIKCMCEISKGEKTIGRFECMSNTKGTLSLLWVGASAFCLNSQTLKLPIMGRVALRFKAPQISKQNISVPSYGQAFLKQA
jgi:hypothetical protein